MENPKLDTIDRKPAILFVDDEPKLLSSLRRMIRPWRDSIDAQFASSGAEALSLLAKKHFDVVVSDMRMPGMSGGELLKSIRRTDPEALRVVLSGQADTGALLEALEATHRYLSKPCEIGALESILKDAILGKFWVDSIVLRKHIALLPSLPCQSLVVEDFRHLLSSNASKSELAKIAYQDLGLSLRLIHLAHALVPDNSLSSSEEALAVLSTDLLLQGIEPAIIHSVGPDDSAAELLAQISEKSQIVASYAKQIAQEFLPSDANRLEKAGYLSGVGSLVLMSCFGSEFVEENRLLSSENTKFQPLDARRIGAFLLTLWGLGNGIPRIVAGEVSTSAEIQPARIIAAAQHMATLALSHGLTSEPLTKAALSKIEPFLRGAMIFNGDN